MNSNDLSHLEARREASEPRWGRFGAVVAWSTVILVIAGMLGAGALLSNPSSETAEGDADTIGIQEELVGRVVLGLAGLSPKQAYQNAAALEDARPIDRVAYAILVAAIDGPEAGRVALDDADLEGDPTLETLVPAVHAAFDVAAAAMGGDETTAATLSEADVETLDARLGWFGDLAAALSDPEAFRTIEAGATRAMIGLVSLLAFMLLLGVLGLIGLGVLIGLVCMGQVSLPYRPATTHGVYIETFALWLVGFLLLQMLIGEMVPEQFGMASRFLGFFASLVVLAWPVLRGLSWSQVREDVGLTRLSFGDVPAGVATYAMSLPFLAIGVGIALLLSLLIQISGGEVGTPSHPIQDAAPAARGMLLLELFLIATIAAPIVEEIMFRGVLYAHLRGASRRWRRILSIAFSALVSSAIFAIIHPQGPVFAPVLAGLAVGFCVGREWRGSIYAPMIAHGLNNAVVLGINVVLLGG